MRDFVSEVVKCKENMIYIKLSQEDLEQIHQFTNAVISQ